MGKKKQFDQPEEPTLPPPEIFPEPEEIPYVEPHEPEIAPQEIPTPEIFPQPDSPPTPEEI